MREIPADDDLTHEPPGETRTAPEIEPIQVPISDVLDLHPFQPREVASVVREYLTAAIRAGYRHLRIIHGRGKGVQRNTVRTLLERDPRVTAFGDAPLGAGGWGATWVEMSPEMGPEPETANGR